MRDGASSVAVQRRAEHRNSEPARLQADLSPDAPGNGRKSVRAELDNRATATGERATAGAAAAADEPGAAGPDRAATSGAEGERSPGKTSFLLDHQ